jgi:phosphohistidine phosphatase SixA
MNRREVLRLGAASGIWVLKPGFAQTTLDLPALLRKGSCVVMLRHAQTEPGIGDPPGYRLDQCSTQRNLSAEGKEQARQIGQWFKARGLTPRSVQTSPWCRCKDTAELAFGAHTVLSSLASTFDNRGQQDSQTQELRARLKNIPAGHFEAWVTHQVNITALTGEVPAMGEAVLVNSQARLLGRTLFMN